MVKNSPANAGHIRDAGSVHGSGSSPGGGHGNPLHYSCLEKPMDRGAWHAPVHGVTKESDMTERLTLDTSLHYIYMYIYVYKCIYTYFQIIFHYRLLQGIEYCSLCYTVTTG